MSTLVPLDDAALKYGLLLETAQTQQKLIASSLRQLKGHTQELDVIVREQIRRTLVEELGAVVEESARAIQALRTLERAAKLRFIAWTLAATLLSGAATGLSAWWLLPSPSQISALRLKREQLAAALESLEQRGGLIDLRRCGSDERWCVRVDRRAPTYGEQADYLVVKGY
jgi:ParB-like chromosome segregation protein Spo0J